MIKEFGLKFKINSFTYTFVRDIRGFIFIDLVVKKIN